CAPVSAFFNDLTSGISSRLWIFDGTDTSTSANPNRTFSTEGVHTVKLKVISVNGCSDSLTKDIIVYGHPNPGFSSDTAGLSATFTPDDQTGGNIYSWTFGDGGTSTDKNPTHTYDTTRK